MANRTTLLWAVERMTNIIMKALIIVGAVMLVCASVQEFKRIRDMNEIHKIAQRLKNENEKGGGRDE